MFKVCSTYEQYQIKKKTGIKCSMFPESQGWHLKK